MPGDRVRPELTIVVPSYQRRHQLNRLLDSIVDATPAILVSDHDPTIEVVVVLDGSTDGSRQSLERRTDPLAIDVVWQPNAGLAAARNAGLDRARGRLVWLLDDDMVINAGALARHLNHDRKLAPVLMAPCVVVSTDPDVLYASSFYEDRHRRLGVAGQAVDPQDCSFANTSAPRQLLQRYRFDESFRGYGTEDFELATRLLRDRVIIAFDASAAVSHELRSSRLDRRRKLREEGANRVRFVELHPDRGDVVFKSQPGRIEGLLRRVARPSTTEILLLGGALIGRIAGLLPASTTRNRLSTWADLLAVYSGVGARGGRRSRLR